MAQTVAEGSFGEIDLRGTASRRRRERTMKAIFFAAAAFCILLSVLIVASVAGGAIQFVSKVEFGTLWSSGWAPRRNQFDVKTIVAGTIMVSVIAMMLAAPVGLGAAIYLSEYASPRRRRFLKPILETLASIPSVVMAFFAIRFISPNVVQGLFGPDVPLFNLTAAGLAVGLLVTPLVASVAEDAMYAVPNSMREASVGLGARKRTTSLRVVVPAAVSGISAALILGISRAIGETMIVAIVGGGTGSAQFSLNPLEGGQPMTSAITALATGSDQVRGSGPAYYSQFFVALILFAFTLGLNVVSERFVRRVRSRY